MPRKSSKIKAEPYFEFEFYWGWFRCHFVDFVNGLHIWLSRCDQRVSGGIILAPEGINGSICGTRESVEKVLGFIQRDDRLNGLRQIESPVSPEEEALHHGHSSSSPLAAGEDAPFRWDHVRVKLKKEVMNHLKRFQNSCWEFWSSSFTAYCFLRWFLFVASYDQIVSLGMPTVSPIERVGKYVSPRDWNALISDPDTVSSSEYAWFTYFLVWAKSSL